MVKDPVCGANVDEAKSILKIEKDGATHFFCSKSCMKRFKSDSQKFLKPAVK
jgi:Cu+-exporting ATPase